MLRGFWLIEARLNLEGNAIRKICKDLGIFPHRMLPEICGYVRRHNDH